MSIIKRDFPSVSGVTPGIGWYLAGMEEVDRQVHDAVASISNADIGRAPIPEAHSIGALVLHLAESEWFWMQCVVSGHRITEADRREPRWDALKDPDRIRSRGYSADFCLSEMDRVRAQTRATLASLRDADLDLIFTFEWEGTTHEQSLRWILHHLMDHEAQHKGQILMLRRLLGLKNPYPLD